MVTPLSDPEAQDEISVGPAHESPLGTPRWVKIFGIIILLLILAFVILKLTGVGGDHGSGRHTSSEGIERLAVLEMAREVGATTPDAMPFGSSSANRCVMHTVAFVGIAGNQAVDESVSMVTTLQRFGDDDPLDLLLERLTGTLRA